MASASKKHRRGPWSQGEDQYLLQLVQAHGAHNWVRISELIQFRSPKQCRERYHQNLKPSLNLSPISPEEGALIERMVNEMGKRWAEIARRLHGRSDNAVKNWWNGGMNRRKRLEGRRAEAARKISVHRPSMDQQNPPAPFAMNPSFDYTPRAAYTMDQFPQLARMQPVPHPVFTGHPQMPTHRGLYDPQIPSPSAVSSGSHPDSEDGAPPSLISDSTRAYSTNQSPQSPHPNVELPPLAAMPGEKYSYLQSAQDYAYAPQAWPQTSQDMYQSRDMAQAAAANTYYQYSGYDGRTPVLPSQGAAYHQFSLPPFNSITAPDMRQHGGPVQSKDSRMSLSKLVD